MATTEQTVGEVMLRRPKTLPADATVADAREAFGNKSVQVLLLVDGDYFYGAVTELPAYAQPGDALLTFADDSTPIVSEDLPVSVALDSLDDRPHGRLIVLGEDNRLAGLVCLAKVGVTFCGGPPDCPDR